MMDDVIKDLAATHGHDDLSDDQLKGVKTTLAGAYVDDILDNQDTEQPETTETTDVDGKA